MNMNILRPWARRFELAGLWAFFAFAARTTPGTPTSGMKRWHPRTTCPIKRNVSLIVRLNKPYYDRQKFLKNGIDHVALLGWVESTY